MIWIPGVALLGGALGYVVGKLLESDPAASSRWVSRKYRDKLMVAFYGAASSGKSSAVKTLFGLDVNHIHPIPGTTDQVYVWRLPSGISIADTPGLQDIDEGFVLKAKSFIDDVDIFVYLINANGGINEKVQADLNLLKAVKRPFLAVLNKIDTIHPGHRQEFFEHQLVASGVPRENMMLAAFDPIPSISPHPINVEAVRAWIGQTVKGKGEDLLREKRTAEIVYLC
jgi:predicted GTPase